MSGYGIALALHSWLRWVLLVVLLLAFVRALGGVSTGRVMAAADRALRGATVGLMHLQLLVGAVLYVWLSPITPKDGESFRAAMKVSGVRFFAVEHVTLMLIALIVAQIGASSARRAKDDRTAFRRIAIGFGIALLLILAAIPWPGLPWGRPLFRGF